MLAAPKLSLIKSASYDDDDENHSSPSPQRTEPLHRSHGQDTTALWNIDANAAVFDCGPEARAESTNFHPGGSPAAPALTIAAAPDNGSGVQSSTAYGQAVIGRRSLPPTGWLPDKNHPPASSTARLSTQQHIVGSFGWLTTTRVV